MKRSSPQPFVNVTIKIVPTHYTDLGFDLSAPTVTCQIPAMADTGCQSCLAGMKVIRRLGLRTVNNGDIKILGATILRISGTDSQGKILETRQMTYIKDSSDKLFRSKEACIALEMILHTFPSMGVATSPHTTQHAVLHEDQTKTCSCPRRQQPPPPPTKLPFPAVEENRVRLQQFLLDYYKSSTFNTCEHQTLPLMDTLPIKLMVDPQAEPVAHHTPVPVPLHWRDPVWTMMYS